MKKRINRNNEDSGGLAIKIAIATIAGFLFSLLISLLRPKKIIESDSSVPETSFGKRQFDESSQVSLGSDQTQSPSSVSPRDYGNLPLESRDFEQSESQSSSSVGFSRWSPTTKYIVAVFLFISIIFFLYLSRGSISMIIFAGLIAFIVRPAILFFKNHLNWKQGLATIVTYLIVLLVLIITPMIVIPAIVNAVNNVINIDFQSIIQNLTTTLQSTADNVSGMAIIGPSLASFLDTIVKAIEGALSLKPVEPVAVEVSFAKVGSTLAGVLGTAVKILGPLISAIVSFGFMLLISLQMSLSIDMINEAYPKAVPAAYRDEIVSLVNRIINIWRAFLRGQLLLMLIIGVLVYLLNLILGTSNALFLGLIAGLLELIPSLGPFLATIPAIVFALIFGSSYIHISPIAFALIVALGYIVIQALENQLIVPKVLGGAVDLPPLAVIIGVLIFGSLFGILGVFLATPVISSGKEIYAYLFNKILEPPHTEEPEKPQTSLRESLVGFTHRIQNIFRRKDNVAANTQLRSDASQIESLNTQ